MAERTISGASPRGRSRRKNSPPDATVAHRDGIVADLLYAAADLRAKSDDRAMHDLAARLEALARRVETGELAGGRRRR
jgi:hypothetical protein